MKKRTIERTEVASVNIVQRISVRYEAFVRQRKLTKRSIQAHEKIKINEARLEHDERGNEGKIYGVLI